MFGHSLYKEIHHHLFLFLAMLCFWMKSYFAFLYGFHLDIENSVQSFILFITPLSSTLFFFGFSLFFTGKLHKFAVIAIDFMLTAILYANILYHRFFNDFITAPDIMQFNNFSQLSGSAKALAHPTDLLYWLDVIIIIGCAFLTQTPLSRHNKRPIASVFMVALMVFVVNLTLAEGQRTQLLSRAFDRAKLVKLLGLYNYHIYDTVINIRTSTQKAFADSSDATQIKNYVKANEVPANPEFFGKAKGKNVILISLESTQNFLINAKLHNEEVTPFLNQLAKNTFYFNNFYHNTGQGKTSDAEFLIDNSLYPLPRGAVYTTNAHNKYEAIPALLKKFGYTSVVFHGNHKSFWNRDIMYRTLGYDRFYSEKDFNVTEKNSINYGLKDKPFFQQAFPKLKNLKQPFYAKFIMLSNHFPFILDHGEASLERADTGDGVVNRYFQTARYEDEALEAFFHQLKTSGLYENSVIILYGDHYGLSDNHNKGLAKALHRDTLTRYDHYQLQKVPLFIHIPGMDGKRSKTMETVGGEIDLQPTILHLLGIQTEDNIVFGSDLFSSERESLTVLRDGSAISNQYIYANPEQTCYSKSNGDIVDLQRCTKIRERAKQDLAYSDKVIYGDLLRFLKNEDTK
ncbi:lipoteichoic acid synthase [Pullulanibacillus pueri]|uniref:Lipoteichoic acid synthase-like YqgS n=1 Tax=Pullulanibacillus pueri TaxID=1437324 RepID=A0A8J2ZTE9_9BACL|nr:LTA synthase family protein [Pullulanibacillus pueri]MBM7681178.1 lipoteichoic acid synthase [Pullulanibacillus pueri]GGH77353.1 lipoteichoic acid synthase-like YqgS [Pullulanibacillus pueri]